MPSSAIDTALGGDLLKGKKTMLAVIAYVIMSILQVEGVVGYATPQTAAASPQPAATAEATAPAPAAASAETPAGTPPAGAPASATPSTATPDAATPNATITSMSGGQTPTGVVLTTLIAAFGGLGLLAKVDRGINALGMIAGASRKT